MQQSSEEWFAARCGKVTASRIADLMAITKSGPSASRKNYAAQLVTERLTGSVEAGFSNAAMQWGTETEPLARSAYSFMTGNAVKEVGFVDHPTIDMAGASPDGMVGTEGLVEIKCPNTATHIATLLSDKVPTKYIKQMDWQMACTGRVWCDFVSFDPRLPEHLKLFVLRVHMCPDRQSEMQSAVVAFQAEITDTLAALDALASKEPAQ